MCAGLEPQAGVGRGLSADDSEDVFGLWWFTVEFYAYSNSGNKGISASLIGVQKVKDGDRLDGEPPKAEDVFGVVGGQTPTDTGLGF